MKNEKRGKKKGNNRDARGSEHADCFYGHEGVLKTATGEG